jgi:glucose/arabinose dehydrogenase
MPRTSFPAREALSLGTILVASSVALAGDVEPLTTTRVASGLIRPIFVTHAPGDHKRLFIVEKRGLIKILNLKTGTVNGSPFLNIDPIVGGGVTDQNEQGLLCLAFHPDYQANGRFFINYTNNSGATTIAEYTRSSNPDLANPTGDVIMTFSQPFSNHNGGWLGFSPYDGYFYIATGDGGSANDPGDRASDITNMRLGKLLRIDVDGDDFPADSNRDYAIPDDNPFVGVTGDDEIWAYGLRNPWRCAFDRANGDLYIADVGQFQREEINYQRAQSAGGEHYGWKCYEGFGCTGFSCQGDNCADNFVEPIHQYTHSLGCSVTGGYVYRGCDIPTLDGHYFFADYCSARIWSFSIEGGVPPVIERTAELDPIQPGVNINWITGFGEDARGELYIVEQQAGEIFKIVPEVPTVSPWDLDCNGSVDVDDLLAVILAWGDCDGCPEDIVEPFDQVTVDELVGVILNWTD